MSEIVKISRDRFEGYKKQHYELWDWLARNPNKKKWEWEGFKYCEPIVNNCFTCQFSHDLFELNFESISRYAHCVYCPCKDMGCDLGLFTSWECSTDKDKRAELAKQIRDLEWSEKFVEE